MATLRVFVALIAIGIIGACATKPGPSGEPPVPEPQVPEPPAVLEGVQPATSEPDQNARPAAPRGFVWGAGDTLVHPPSGACFEKEYAGFIRQDSFYQYDAQGLDVSAEYYWPEHGVLVTLYVYPTYTGPVTEKTLLAEYGRCMAEIYETRNVTTLLGEESGMYEFDSGTLPGHLAAMVIEEGREYASFLMLFGKNEWYVLFRISALLEQVQTLSAGSEMTAITGEFDFGAIQ
jgi:hypothetical protein